MNTKYKKLFDIANYSAGTLMASNATEEEIQEQARQLFAQLIVLECAKVCENVGLMEMDQAKGRMYADAIKEYFGDQFERTK